MHFSAEQRLNALRSRRRRRDGGFGFTCPTLPRGITKADLTYDASGEIMDQCRLHMHLWGMKHCPEYHAWFTAEERLLKLKREAANERHREQVEARHTRLTNRSRLKEIWSAVLEGEARERHESQLHVSPAHRTKKPTLFS